MSLKNINPTKTSSWKSLKNHFNEIKDIEMKEMFKNGKKHLISLSTGIVFQLIFLKTELIKKHLVYCSI